ncbi:substrate-binding domain-containing protein [Sulfurimonas sp.]|uniref:substrate-binding domain-containing protein n=1 Tax=Sulfurimonas sp. TaxID=2022749 RepID=UPI003568FA05
MLRTYFFKVLVLLSVVFSYNLPADQPIKHNNKEIVYIVSDTRIPFWSIMAKGVESKAKELGYGFSLYTADNILKKELQNTVKTIKQKPAGVILSPTNSSSAVTILKLLKNANIPVVISDIGTDSGEYVSFISSNNEQGAYDIGRVLTKEMKKRGLDYGTVGIISIPQTRENGKARTQGFMRALNEADIKASNLYQQVDFSYKETYDFSMELIHNDPNLRAIWLQGSDRYKGALDAIKKAGKKGKILLICFDAEPIFLELIPNGVLVGAAMQQPFLMGEKAVESLDAHLNSLDVARKQQLPILAISKENIKENLKTIHRNVLGLNAKK